MPVYAIAQGRIENREMLDEYVAKVIPTIQSGGGRSRRTDAEARHGRPVVT